MAVVARSYGTNGDWASVDVLVDEEQVVLGLINFRGEGALSAAEDVADRVNAVLDAAKQQYRNLLCEAST